MPQKGNGHKNFYDWSPIFLQELAQCGNVTQAMEEAGISRETVYRHRKQNEWFKDRWDEALEEAADRLEMEARRRAVEGVPRIKTYQGGAEMVPLLDERGQVVLDEDGEEILVPHVEHNYSDTLLIFLLKSVKPEKFRDRYDMTTAGDKIESSVNIYIPDNGRDDIED